MSLLMFREAYVPVNRCPDFHCGRVQQPESVQEALADLKIIIMLFRFCVNEITKNENCI